MSFDNDFAKKIIGYTVVVGFNHLSKQGVLLRKSQRHGVIVEADEKGIVIRQPDGERLVLPPDFAAMALAKPGVYTLRSTKEKIENPAYTIQWDIWGDGEPDVTWRPSENAKPA